MAVQVSGPSEMLLGRLCDGWQYTRGSLASFIICKGGIAALVGKSINHDVLLSRGTPAVVTF